MDFLEKTTKSMLRTWVSGRGGYPPLDCQKATKTHASNMDFLEKTTKSMLRTWVFWKKPPKPCFEHGFFGKNHQNPCFEHGVRRGGTPPWIAKKPPKPMLRTWVSGPIGVSGGPWIGQLGDPGLANWGTPPGLANWGTRIGQLGNPGLANWGTLDWPIGEPGLANWGTRIGQLGNPIGRPWEPSEIGFQKPHFSIEKIAIFNTNPLSQVRIAGLSKIGGFGSNYLR